MTPTPRGGGIAIAFVSFAAIVIAVVARALTQEVSTALVGGGVAIAFIGWLDDRHEIGIAIRAIVHILAAAWAVFWLGGLPELRIGETAIQLGWFGSVLAVLSIVWFINLYNFMDGSDGLAATEGVSVALVAGTILMAHRQVGLAVVSLAIAGAALGFLVRNWAPASIFMGDVGSGLLGFLFATLALASERQGTLPLLAWMILLGVFVVDATVTLLRRVVRGERWYAGHRSHAYQRLAQAGWAHSRIASGLLTVNLILAGFVAVSALRPRLLLAMVAIAVFVLASIYARIEKVAPWRPLR
jgi:Fuc2NAc and GlcNAc transferase